MRGLSLRYKGKLYAACIRNAVLYGNETLAVWAEDVRERRPMRTEMRMTRWMRDASLRERAKLCGEADWGRLAM